MTEILEGIPQDVWSAALDIDIDADFGWDGQTTTGLQAERECRLSIARAILAERERCANVAKEMLKFADTTSGADEAIPAAILDPNHWLARNPALAPA